MTSKVEIVEAIWSIDPAGISTIREDAPMEYDEVANGAYWRLAQGDSAQMIVQWIDDYFVNVWGVTIRSQIREQIEEQLVVWASRPSRQEPGGFRPE